MAKKKDTSRNKIKNEPAKKKKQKFNWQLLIAIAVIVIGTGVYYTIEQPSSEELDLSVIEQGKNVVVQIHDPG